MRRHSKEGRETIKARRRKTVTRKRRNSPKMERSRPIVDTQQTEAPRGSSANGTRRWKGRGRRPKSSVQ